KVRYINTNFRLKENQWSEGAIINYTNATAANAVLRKQISDIEKELLSNELSGNPIGRKISHSFEAFAKEVKGTGKANLKEINRLQSFGAKISLPRVSIEDINVAFLRKYE